MPAVAEPKVVTRKRQSTSSKDNLEPRYNVICWDDSVNQMNFVTHVFQTIFGWERKRAEKHMLEVHEKGKSILTQDGAEKAEFFVHQLQKYKLHATMELCE